MMHIGELAEKTGLSLRTIRHYDEVGLLKPSGRTQGGFRLYTEEDLKKLLVVRRMKPLGFTLEEMRDLLLIVTGFAESPADPVRQQGLSGFLDAIEERRRQLRADLEMADEFAAILRSHQV